MTQNEMLKAIYDDMQELKGDVQELKGDVEDLKSGMKVLKGDVEDLKTGMKVLEGEVEGLKTDVKVLKTGMKVLEGNVRDLQLTLENETNRNIRIIAEGHLDLNRKLDKALETESEKELMSLRLNVLENDMRKVKEKVGIA